MDEAILSIYKSEADKELTEILSYWMRHTLDNENGGFYGKVDNENNPHLNSPKGIVLNSRILWAFSAAYDYSKKEEYLLIAERAYDYIITHFIDPEFGGTYWSVDCHGKMQDDKKQIYGIAFCIYGMIEYYKAKKEREALEHSINFFKVIEEHAYDKDLKGYYEAFDRRWKPLADLRLSVKDANEKKTANTHLHIIEAYANLYEIWPDLFLRSQIENLLENFVQHIINKKTSHLDLFFDEGWQAKHQIISYGHDIESAWLLKQCAEKIGQKKWVDKMKIEAIKITDAASEGLDGDGGLWYEYDELQKKLTTEKHSWPQAEAMIGFMNAYEITGNKKYLEQSYKSWEFVKSHIKDNRMGEWFWGVNADNSIMKDQDKAGFWKCPYHNTRACLELIKRISAILNN